MALRLCVRYMALAVDKRQLMQAAVARLQHGTKSALESGNVDLISEMSQYCAATIEQLEEDEGQLHRQHDLDDIRMVKNLRTTVVDLYQQILKHERGRLDIGVFSDYEQRTEEEKKAQVYTEESTENEGKGTKR